MLQLLPYLFEGQSQVQSVQRSKSISFRSFQRINNLQLTRLLLLLKTLWSNQWHEEIQLDNIQHLSPSHPKSFCVSWKYDLMEHHVHFQSNDNNLGELNYFIIELISPYIEWNVLCITTEWAKWAKNVVKLLIRTIEDFQVLFGKWNWFFSNGSYQIVTLMNSEHLKNRYIKDN